MTIPDEVKLILDEIKKDPRLLSIWFFGSRANNKHTPESDYDFFLFYNFEQFGQEKQYDTIDFIRIGPSGEGFTDGGQCIKLKDWNWKIITDSEAVYTERKVIDYSKGYRDHKEPVFQYRESKAIKIWPK